MDPCKERGSNRAKNVIEGNKYFSHAKNISCGERLLPEKDSIILLVFSVHRAIIILK